MGTMIDSGCRRSYGSTKRGKLFFCFNSRFFSSSSSINVSSRSILSPARHPLSLSASLSRRMRGGGGVGGGGQSPMFPTASVSKKRASGVSENPEPSSPKVTCIGQVRVKSKKKKRKSYNSKHMRNLRNPSRRRSGGDGKFRRTDYWGGSIDLSSSQSTIMSENRHWNQRLVHLPLTICEGLKCLGAEISCLLPCRSSSPSSCFSTSRKRERSIRSNMEEMEISNKVDAIEEDEEEEEEGRLSVCVPPKNALILMRCRSDPVRMAALSRRLLESPLTDGDEGEADIVVEDEESEAGSCSHENSSPISPVIGEDGNGNIEADLVIIDIPPEEEEEEENSHGGSSMAEVLGQKVEEEDEDMSISITMEEKVEEEEEEEDVHRDPTMEEKEDEASEEEREVVIDEDDEEELPPADCLLLMMCEPKVSMEVSKETWICTTDFMRFLPQRRRPPHRALADVDEPEKKADETSTNPSRRKPPPGIKQSQPPRSSCSIPGKAAPMLTAQKLPRCKSEPMRAASSSSSSKLVASETCLWKSRKVEPLRRLAG